MRKVKVVVYGGAVVEKVLVDDSEDVLLLTTEEEWNAAQRENRPVVSVGFRREYLVL